MSVDKRVFIGTDGGATTTKIGGVWADASTVSTSLLQRPTGAEHGPEAVMRGWAEAVAGYLSSHGLGWDAVQAIGVALAGPQRSYGVLERGPNLPETFAGYDVLKGYGEALAERARRAVPLVVGNDGNMGGVAEAQRVRGDGGETVVLLACGGVCGSSRTTNPGERGR